MRRVLLKISGEALLGRKGSSIDLKKLSRIAEEIKKARSSSLQLGVVIGGGNIWRGARNQGLALDRVISDNMGMLATLLNSLAFQNILEQNGIPTRVMSAIPVQSVAEPFIRRRAIRHMEKKRVVVIAAGTGNPYFSTDTAAALRASEMGADLLLKATDVRGVYSGDPKKSRKAKFFEKLTLTEALANNVGVMDTAALVLCLENKVPIRVFNLHVKGNITQAIKGKSIGTLVTPS